MSDFFQNGTITTLHRLNRNNRDILEQEIVYHSQRRPIALVLPALYSELESPALPKIVEALKEVPYLSQIVITMGRTDEEQFRQAKKFFEVLPQQKMILWNDGPALENIHRKIEAEFGGFEKGKGLSAWMAYGYVLAARKCLVIALHDCDILSYDPEMLARLCYPIVNTRLNYEFCKGYYSRVTDRLHGRVTRLFVTPLIRALIQMLGPTPFLVYLDSFRYPLAGEFAMRSDLAWRNRIPSDWGLEVGVLAEIYRNCTLSGICQADLADNYEHKHQDLSAADASKGLMKMTADIAKSLFRTLAGEGVVFSEGFFKSLSTTYVKQAQDAIKHYQDDALINSLLFDRHEEATAMEAFAGSIKLAGDQTLEDPLGIPLIPNWSRVLSALPDVFDELLEAVEQDNA
jgi:glucosyl-3-phosphoglycerate synthase